MFFATLGVDMIPERQLKCLLTIALCTEFVFAVGSSLWWLLVTISSGFCHALRTQDEHEEECGTLYRYWYALGANIYFTFAQIIVVSIFHCLYCNVELDRRAPAFQWLKWFSLLQTIPVSWLIFTIIALKVDSEVARSFAYMWLALVLYIIVLVLRVAIFAYVPCAHRIQVIRAYDYPQVDSETVDVPIAPVVLAEPIVEGGNNV